MIFFDLLINVAHMKSFSLKSSFPRRIILEVAFYACLATTSTQAMATNKGANMSVVITKIDVPLEVLNNSVPFINFQCRFALLPLSTISIKPNMESIDHHMEDSAETSSSSSTTLSTNLSLSANFSTNKDILGAAERAPVFEEAWTNGLVVKWFHDLDPRPVYQWIAGREPQSFGLLAGRLNPSQSADGNLQLLRPTAQLSGSYTCRVSTWSNTASATRRLTVYAPASSMHVRADSTGLASVSLSCHATGLFPEPVMEIYYQTNTRHRRRLSGWKIEKRWRHDSYSVNYSQILPRSTIPRGSIIHCTVLLPGTHHRQSRSIKFLNGGASTNVSAFPLLTMILIVIVSWFS